MEVALAVASGPGGSPEPSLGRKLFMEAQASISVPSTLKGSLESSRLTLGWATMAARNLFATSPASSRSRNLAKVIGSQAGSSTPTLRRRPSWRATRFTAVHRGLQLLDGGLRMGVARRHRRPRPQASPLRRGPAPPWAKGNHRSPGRGNDGAARPAIPRVRLLRCLVRRYANTSGSAWAGSSSCRRSWRRCTLSAPTGCSTQSTNPFGSLEQGRAFLDKLQVDGPTLVKIAHANADQLFKLDVRSEPVLTGSWTRVTWSTRPAVRSTSRCWKPAWKSGTR